MLFCGQKTVEIREKNLFYNSLDMAVICLQYVTSVLYFTLEKHLFYHSKSLYFNLYYLLQFYHRVEENN